jgi:hypothetical protein
MTITATQAAAIRVFIMATSKTRKWGRGA